MKSFTENLQMQKIGKEMTEELEESFTENLQMRKIGKVVHLPKKIITSLLL